MESLYDYGRYSVIVIDNYQSDDTGDKEKAYGVVNRETGVIEFRHQLLAQAMKWSTILEKEVAQLELVEEGDLASIPQQGELF